MEEYLTSITQMVKATYPKPEGFVYWGIEDYVLQNGRDALSELLTPYEAEIVREALQEAEGWGHDVHEFKHCYSNAQLLVLSDASEELVYCEGYALGNTLIPIHHGWVQINGKVVDPTWKLKNPADRDLLPEYPVGKLPEGFRYFGVQFPDRKNIRRRIAAKGMIGSLLDGWEEDFPLLRGKPFWPIDTPL